MVKGYRKLIMTAIIGAIVAVVPEATGHDMTPAQVDLLKTLIAAAFGGNAVEHITGVIKDAMGSRGAGSTFHSVRPVSDPEQAPATEDRH